MPIIRTTDITLPSPLREPPDSLDKKGDAGASRDTISIASILAALRRHALLVAGSTVIVGALSAAIVLLETPSYRATAVLQLSDARRAMTRGIDNEPTDRPRDANPVMSQFQLLTSRTLIGTVVDSEGLRLRPSRGRFSVGQLTQVHIEPAVREDTFRLRFSKDSVIVQDGSREDRVAYNQPFRTSGVSFAVTSNPGVDRAVLVVGPREETIDQVLKNLRVSQRFETSVVNVSYTDDAPEIAQRVVNRLVTTFQDDDVRQSQGQSRRRRVFLEEQLREVSSQLTRSESALASFRSQQQVFSPREKFQAEQTSLMTLDMRIGELDADRRVYESLLTDLQTARNSRNTDQLRTLISTPDVGSNPVITQIYQQLSQYQTTRDSLTTGQWRATANNPDVARLDQLISGSEERLINAVRGHLSAVDARREALAALRTRNSTAIAVLPRAESAEDQLSRQLESNRALADRLRDEYQKARMAEAVEAGQVAIMDLASIPYRPVARLRTLRLLLGVLIGFGIGCLAALVIDSSKAPVRGRLDLEDEMQLRVLAVIPPIPLEGAGRGASFSRLAAALANGKNRDGDQNGARRTTSLMSPAGAEAFRLLRSSLKWTQSDGAGKTLAISSALSGEGKTTTSANLAAVCAFEGKRVLLIDCDLRRPRLHQVFHLPRQPGMSQVLWSGLSASAAVRDTEIDGLFVLPAGAYTERFADLIGSSRMPKLLAELSECFDTIILDTPPVLAVADTTALAPLVDGVLLVVGAGATDRHAVAQALQQLKGVGARVVGAVLNDSRGELQRHDSHYRYSQYQGEYAQSTSNG